MFDHINVQSCINLALAYDLVFFLTNAIWWIWSSFKSVVNEGISSH